mgnify:CR=1 FL=1
MKGKKKSDGLSLSECVIKLARQAQEETDPFMRKLLLFTAGGVAAGDRMDMAGGLKKSR